MTVKGFLRICAGIIGSNVLTFQDTEVSPAVSLKRLTQDHHAGFCEVKENVEIEVESEKVSIFTKKFTQHGFIRHSGYIKRGA